LSKIEKRKRKKHKLETKTLW